MTGRNARFARRRDLADLRSPDYGVFLGYQGSTPLLSDTSTHTLVVAPTRAGKGVGLLVPTALSWPHSMIVLDPKGEFRALTANWRGQYQRCATWGPTTFGTRWNPIQELTEAPAGERTEQAMRLAAALTARTDAPAGNGAFWHREAQNFLAGALEWASTVEATLGHVYDLLNQPTKLDAVQAALTERDDLALSRWAQDHRAKSDSERSGVRSTALSFLRSLASGPVRDATSAAELRYVDMLAPQTTVYLHCTANDFNTHGGLITAFIEGFIHRVLSDLSSLQAPLLLLLDEFSLLQHLPSLQTVLTLAAGYGVRLLLVLQNLSQLERKTREVVTTNCHDQVYFAARDPETTKYLSDRLGTTMRAHTTRSTGRGGTSRSKSERREALLEPHQIRAMKRALLFHGNAPAAQIRLHPYFKDKRFTPRLGDSLPPTPIEHDPPTLDALLTRHHPGAITQRSSEPRETPDHDYRVVPDGTEHNEEIDGIDELASLETMIEATDTDDTDRSEEIG